MAARCFVGSAAADIAGPWRRAMDLLAEKLDGERIVLAGIEPGFELVVADPLAGFIHVWIDPDPDIRPAGIIDRLARRLDSVWGEIGTPAQRYGGIATLAIADAPIDALASIAWDILAGPSGPFFEAFDEIGADPPPGTRAVPETIARELVARFALAEYRSAPAHAQAAPVLDARPVPTVADVADGMKTLAREAAAVSAPAAPLNRFARISARRQLAEIDRARQVAAEEEARKAALDAYGLDMTRKRLSVPPLRLAGASAMRDSLFQTLCATEPETVQRLAIGTLARLKELSRGDIEREGFLEGVEMLRALSRERGLRLALPPGISESREINARCALAAACAGHYFDSDLAAARILSAFAASGSDIDDVVGELLRDPARFGRIRRANNRPRRVRTSGLPAVRRRPKRKAPEWRSIQDTASDVRGALENIAALGLAGPDA